MTAPSADTGAKRDDSHAQRGWGPALATAIVLIVALAIGAIGLLLLVIGGQLARLGGSPYYGLAGLWLVATALLAALRDRRAVWLYGALLAITIVWAIWEAGFAAWPLVPRVAGPAVVGLWFALPLAYRREDRPAARGARWLIGGLSGVTLIALACLLFAGPPATVAHVASVSDQPLSGKAEGDWTDYGHDAAGTRFSPLSEITPANVAALKPLWTVRTGHDFSGPTATFETTPLEAGGRLFLCTPYDQVIALDPDTGRPLWRFDPHASTSEAGMTICRGVAWYRSPTADPAQPCAERVYVATIDARLIALDAATGRRCEHFGASGEVSLLDGMGKVEKGYYLVTSAPQVVRGRIVLGGSVADNMSTGEPSGVVRAYDAMTGALAWAWDVGRPDRQGAPAAGDQYTRGTPNSWGPISADDRLGLVYLPTGNATPDWFGGLRRPIDDRVSSSIVALDIETGRLRWSFQTTHHDLWDYDVGSQPSLFDLVRDGRRIPALVLPTKRGETFLLDRATGRPLSPVVERPVPPSHVAGERAAPTQPYPVLPSVAGPRLTEAMMWGLSPIDQAWCRLQFRRARYEGAMTPPELDRPIIVYPGYMGGSDWGSGSVDTSRGILVLNPFRMAMQVQLITRREADARGLRPIAANVHGKMGGASPMAGTPYGVDVKPFLSPLGVPCQQPPYGALAAIDLVHNMMLWQQPLGTTRNSGPWSLRSHLPFVMGTPNLGGAVTTASGLTFVAAAQDGLFRAFETRTGRQVWQAELPAGGQATPMTFRSPRSGRQIVVIAAGGHAQLGTPLGDYVVAFALPQTTPAPATSQATPSS